MLHPSRLALLFALALLVFPARSALASTTIPGGTLTTQTWSPAGSPYIVQGDIVVPTGATLTIQAGTVVQFYNIDTAAAGLDTNRVELTVQGALAVNGTTANPVTLQVYNTGFGTPYWYGIVASANASSVVIDGAIIQNADYAVTNNAPGSVTRVLNTTVSASGYGIHSFTGSPILSRLNVSGASYGLWIDGDSSATISDSIVTASQSYGIDVSTTSGNAVVAITGSTIHGNGAAGVNVGSFGSATTTVDIKNCNITTNVNDNVVASGAGTTVNLSYSNVWNPFAFNFAGVTPGAGVISCNPLYVNAPSNFRLTSNSPSRFAGEGGVDLGPLPYVSDKTPGLYGTLWNDTTVPAGTTAVAGDIVVPSGVTLTLSPGTTLDFANTTDIMVCGFDPGRPEIDVRGRLVANGTASQPIKLVSTASIQNGAWAGLEFESSATNSSVVNARIESTTDAITVHSPSSTNVFRHILLVGTGVGFTVTDGGSADVDGLDVYGATYGFYVKGTGAAHIVNSLLKNSVNYGLYVDAQSGVSTVNLVNSTLNANVRGVYVNAAFGATANVTLVNDVLANNSQYGVFRTGTGTTNIAVTYSDVWNSTTNFGAGLSPGAGCISADPLFIAPPSNLTVDGGSPVNNAGTSIGVPDHDLLDVPRPQGGAWDMGAYEFGGPATFCGDGVVQAGEACDEGALNGLYGHCTATCTGLGPHCGDGQINGPEACDDGNNTDGDGCSATCTIESTGSSTSASSSTGASSSASASSTASVSSSAGTGSSSQAGSGGASSSSSEASVGSGGGASTSSAGSGASTGSATASNGSGGSQASGSGGASTGSQTSGNGGSSQASGGGGAGGGQGDNPPANGCGCRTAGGSDDHAASALALGLALAFARRRPRRRPATSCRRRQT